MESDDFVYTCALSRVFAYKCADGRRLVEAFGSPSAVFAASRKDLLAAMHHAEAVAGQLCDPALLDWAADEVSWTSEHGVELLTYFDRRYPRRLAECDDAPLMLYYKGSADLNASRVLSVVGTRKASWYGRDTCRKIVAQLASLKEKPLIVSGLALGIDGCAHAAALEAGLQTVAVMPTGIDEIYPRQHRELAARIVESGALVTDFARLTAPAAHTFIRRNRIIAGMADATLLAESYAKGGGLITVSLAESYGREVFAVPGRLSDYSFEGCHAAIGRNIAQLVSSYGSIAEAMGWGRSRVGDRNPSSESYSGDSGLKREILRLLSQRAELSPEDIASISGKDIRDVSVALFELEVDGAVASEFGNKYVRRER